MPKSLILIAALIAASPLSAKSLPLDNKPPIQVARLLACKDLADSAVRLACYDRETAAVGDAISRRDLVVVDRESVKTARRSLFGFSIPSLGGILGNDRDVMEACAARRNGVAEGRGAVVMLFDQLDLNAARLRHSGREGYRARSPAIERVTDLEVAIDEERANSERAVPVMDRSVEVGHDIRVLQDLGSGHGARS